jgi:hypothetical protein
MFNNVVLDVFIGLVFIFLLYSLLATIIQEMIARWLALRSRMLIKALRRMLEDDRDTLAKPGGFTVPAEILLFFKRFLMPIRSNSFLAKFYGHPTIKYLGEDKIFSKPSYLHAHNFSQTVIHLLRGEEYDGRNLNESDLIFKAIQDNPLDINKQTLRNLKHLFADARQDTYLFKNKLEDWYEETMERASGWYKKQTQFILVIIGFFIAYCFNVDSIAISKILMKDKKAREQMVQLASSRQAQYAVIIDSMNKNKTAGDTTTSPSANADTVAVSDQYLQDTYKTLKDDATSAMNILGLNKSVSPYQKKELRFWGWLLTALAISLGAPFWFDLLNKFMKLREGGPKPPNTALQDKPAGAAVIVNPIKGKDGNEIQG